VLPNDKHETSSNLLYSFVIMHLGAFCMENAPILLVAIVTVLVATGLCPVTIGSV
jgi:hypothetical protein